MIRKLVVHTRIGKELFVGKNLTTKFEHNNAFLIIEDNGETVGIFKIREVVYWRSIPEENANKDYDEHVDEYTSSNKYEPDKDAQVSLE